MEIDRFEIYEYTNTLVQNSFFIEHLLPVVKSQRRITNAKSSDVDVKLATF